MLEHFKTAFNKACSNYVKDEVFRQKPGRKRKGLNQQAMCTTDENVLSGGKP